MTHPSKGFRSRTRKKFEQPAGYRPPITKFLQQFTIGQNVVIMQEASSQRGMPFPRFKGKMGKVVQKRGRSYVVELMDGRMMKHVIARPEHLKLLKA
ncbi:50S ribosomal protein L21e [archaeon]|nr:MAG: 50S ribosomal protein L21e [archaeon]